MTVLRCSHAVKAGLLELPVGETGEQRLYSFWWKQRVDEARDFVRHMKGRAGHDSGSRSSSRAGRTGQGVPGSAGSGWSAGRTGEAHTELDDSRLGGRWAAVWTELERLMGSSSSLSLTRRAWAFGRE